MKGVVGYVALGHILVELSNDPRSSDLAINHLEDGHGCDIINMTTECLGRRVMLVLGEVNQELQVYYLKDWSERCVYVNDIALAKDRIKGYLFGQYDTVEVPGAAEIK